MKNIEKIYGDIFLIDTEEQVVELSNLLDDFYNNKISKDNLIICLDNLDISLNDDFSFDGETIREIDELVKDNRELIKLLFMNYCNMRKISFKEVINICKGIKKDKYSFGSKYLVVTNALNQFSDTFLDIIDEVVSGEFDVNSVNIFICTMELVINYLDEKIIDYRYVEGLSLMEKIDSGTYNMLNMLLNRQ